MFDAGSFGFFWLFAFGVIALIAVIATLAHMQAEKRKRDLAAWAHQRGWTFDPHKDFDMDSHYASFGCLQQGSERYAYNVVTGAQAGRDLRAFDYHYETYSTDSKGRRTTHHHHFSAVVLDTEFHLKPLNLRTESLFDKVTEFFGFDDIDFESAEFSREFHVKAPDRKWAFDVLPQATIEFLLESPRFALQMHGRRVIASRSSRFDVRTFESAIAVLDGVLQRLPPGLQKELRSEFP